MDFARHEDRAFKCLHHRDVHGGLGRLVVLVVFLSLGPGQIVSDRDDLVHLLLSVLVSRVLGDETESGWEHGLLPLLCGLLGLLVDLSVFGNLAKLGVGALLPLVSAYEFRESGLSDRLSVELGQGLAVFAFGSGGRLEARES